PVVIAGGELRRADIEFAVLIFAEAFTVGNDHGADSVAAADMAVVVDLDATWRARQREGLCQGAKQFLLRRPVREFPPQRLAGIGKRMLPQFLTLAALGHRHFDSALALGCQRLRQEFALLEIMRHEDATRRWLVVVELREESTQHLARLEGAIGFWEVGAVTPVLSGAKEEYLDTRISPGLVHSENVSLF